jgi:hypothetical protein
MQQNLGDHFLASTNCKDPNKTTLEIFIGTKKNVTHKRMLLQGIRQCISLDIFGPCATVRVAKRTSRKLTLM